MADTIPTVKVKPWGKDQGDFVEINASDFDDDLHDPHNVPTASEEKLVRAAKPARKAKGK